MHKGQQNWVRQMLSHCAECATWVLKNQSLATFQDESFLTLQTEMNGIVDSLSSQSRTAKLCLLDMFYVDVIKLFIIAERTVEWNLHLFSMTKMLNLFAAAGHHQYAKCGRLYIQLMQNLPSTHPEVVNSSFETRNGWHFHGDATFNR